MSLDLNTLDQPRLAWLKKIAISAHVRQGVQGGTNVGGYVYGYSSISHMLGEATHSAHQEYSKYMLPLLGAFSVLDQVGECYSNKATPPFPPAYASKSNIIKALHYFASIPVNSADSDALYGLRNGLAHSARLVSVGEGKNPKHYWFKSDPASTPLFTHAGTPWDGLYNTRNSNNVTIVNPTKLLELVSNVVNNIDDANAKGDVTIVLKNGLEELLKNYVFIEFGKSFEDSYQFHLQHKLN